MKTIRPTSELPQITDRVTIDGYTQPGSSPNTLTTGTNAQLKIELDGSSAGALSDGLRLGSVASDSLVKGLVINRFGDDGIQLRDGVRGVDVEGNFIGTDPSGTLDLGNASLGVLISNGTGIIVGGQTPDKRNLISGNGAGIFDGSGVFIVNGGGNRVQGNLIGTQKDGTSALGNSGQGVDIFASDDNLVGSGISDGANTIAFNGADGVAVSDANSTGNEILLNSIFSNGGLGIDLVGGTESATGANKNDPGDADSGPNDLQNKPVITSATTSGSTTTIRAKLNSTPGEVFRVLFFSNPSGNEGKTPIEADTFFTNSNGNVTFTFVPSQVVSVGQRITATATDLGNNNTSEFSAPKTVVSSTTQALDTTKITGPSGVTKSTTAHFKFDSPEPEATSFECSLDGQAYYPCSSPENINGLSEGAHTFLVRAIDDEGNLDPTPAEWVWEVERNKKKK